VIAKTPCTVSTLEFEKCGLVLAWLGLRSMLG
jgi:hypothetical protein